MSVGRVALKSTTSISLNDRFTVLRSTKSSYAEPTVSPRINRVQVQASQRNQRLAVQMENRPAVRAALNSATRGTFRLRGSRGAINPRGRGVMNLRGRGAMNPRVRGAMNPRVRATVNTRGRPILNTARNTPGAVQKKSNIKQRLSIKGRLSVGPTQRITRGAANNAVANRGQFRTNFRGAASRGQFRANFRGGYNNFNAGRVNSGNFRGQIRSGFRGRGRARGGFRGRGRQNS